MSTGKTNVIVYSESNNFAKIIKTNLTKHDFFSVVDWADNVLDLEKKVKRNKDILVLLCASKVSTGNIAKIFEILEKNNGFCVAVCDSATLSFTMSRKGALTTLIFKEESNSNEVDLFFRHLKVKLKDADKLKSIVKIRTLKQEVRVNSDTLIVFGSSTGGTEALLSVLRELPAEIPPVLVVQHMPAVFTKMYADRLNSICKATVWEAKDGDIIKPGLVLVAPGDMQMRIVKKVGEYAVSCKKEGKVNGVEPSVDVLFDSVCENVNDKKVIAVILTGMGSDGAKGLLNLKRKGAFTIGQDERSSVVYGMPKAAYEMGAVKVQAPLSGISKLILENI